jgi:aldose 1-epimerase
MQPVRNVMTLGLSGLSVLAMSVAGDAQGRYAVRTNGDIVQLADAREQITVSVLTPVSNAYEMVVKGQDVIRKNFASLDALRKAPGLNGIPLLWPYANRLDEQAFYANGVKYSFDTGLGNTGRGAVPIHGYVTNATEWKVVESRADANAAWITSRLEFYRYPRYAAQFPFAHVLTMTYRLADGALEVRTAIENLSSEPMPVAIGFHPYFQLTDAPRENWTLSVPARTHWKLDERLIPSGETEPITAFLPEPRAVPLRTTALDNVFGDLERDAQGRATVTVKSKQQQFDVVVGPNYKAIVLYAPLGGGRGRRGAGTAPPAGGAAAPGAATGAAAASPAPAPPPNWIAIEPMAGITNSMNLAQKGLYKELQSIPPGGTWQESFWLRPRGF